MACILNNASKIYSIEGNIGSGKSTIIKILKDRFKNNNNIIFLLEPVDEWNTICDNNDKTILEKYYEDKKKYAFSFQMMAYISRLSQLKEALKNGYEYIITERSLATDKNVFAKMLYDDNEIDEINYQIYNKWFDEFIKDIPPINYIYIKTDTIITEARIIERSRKGENKILFEYLQKCSNYHDDWFNSITNYLQINGNININNEPAYIQEIIRLFVDYTQFTAAPHYILMFDGGSRGNPGPAGCGYVIYDQSYNIIHEDCSYLGVQTTNYAEYMGVVEGLKKAIELNIQDLIIKGDSLLVVKQLNGSYNVNSENLKPLYQTACSLIKNIKRIQYIHIKREMNVVADTLANIAIDNK
tara:strand:- start:48 stop:1118 length:1071 start_codon:yes stop_codon:yes gene_type:complete